MPTDPTPAAFHEGATAAVKLAVARDLIRDTCVSSRDYWHPEAVAALAACTKALNRALDGPSFSQTNYADPPE